MFLLLARICFHIFITGIKHNHLGKPFCFSISKHIYTSDGKVYKRVSNNIGKSYDI